MERQRLKAKLAEKQLQIVDQEQETIQKQILKMAALGGVATAARMGLQTFPFLEPITMAALLAGTLWGKDTGAAFGASLIYASNFAVFGGNGPWTLFQCLGMAIAGTIGAKLHVTSKKTAVAAAVAATTVYDVITNMLWIAVVGPAAIVSGLPIFLMHLGTNVAMALTLPEIAKKLA